VSLGSTQRSSKLLPSATALAKVTSKRLTGVTPTLFGTEGPLALVGCGLDAATLVQVLPLVL